MSLGVPGNPGTPGSFTADEIEVNGPWRRLKKKTEISRRLFSGFLKVPPKFHIYIYIYIYVYIHVDGRKMFN